MERRGATIWVTGLPSAGKTTLARAIDSHLSTLGASCCVLDGDELREGLSSDLGMSEADRAEQARRVAHIAALMNKSGIVAIVALVSPYAVDRDSARELHDLRRLEFIEVWVDTPLEVCETRDTKRLYERARAGALTGVTGLDAPYETPVSPELHVSGWHVDVVAVASRVVDVMLNAVRNVWTPSI